MRHATLVISHGAIAIALLACSSGPDDSHGDDGSTVTTGSGNTSNAATTGSGNTTTSTTTTAGGGTDPTGSGAGGGSSGEPCAEPGAMGNELGVGQYCQTDGDCSGLDASFCTVAHEPSAPPFCTKPCFDTNECGQGASCEDNGGVLKGCVPACLTQP